MSRVLVISDLHAPFVKKGYLEFLKQQYEAFGCDEVVCVGDLIDFHYISDHSTEPDADNPIEENTKSREILKEFVEAFPNVTVTIGNHDSRIIKRIQYLGFTFDEATNIFKKKFGLESWTFKFEHIVDGALYTHHSPSGNVSSVPAMNLAVARRMPVVAGHIHHAFGVKYSYNGYENLWAVNTGSALDEETYAARYGKNSKYKGVTGCAVILNGTFPIVIPYEQ